MKTIDGRTVAIKVAYMPDKRLVVRAVAGGAIVWGQDFDPGTKPSVARSEAKRALEEMGIVNDS